MTVILIDRSDKSRDYQLANRVWDCIVENIWRERVFPQEKMELLSIPTVGKLNAEECAVFARALRTTILPKLGDHELLFFDGAVGSASRPKDGYGLETPYHLLSHVSRPTLEALAQFLEGSSDVRIA